MVVPFECSLLKAILNRLADRLELEFDVGFYIVLSMLKLQLFPFLYSRECRISS